MPLFENLGGHHHEVTTKSPAAQRYFDQGLRLVYAFNHDEAERAFREAARLDPTCAMAWWGVAFALGPNYNLPIDPERNKKAVDAVAKAQALTSRASPRETGVRRRHRDALRGGASGGSRASRPGLLTRHGRPVRSAFPTTSTPPRSTPSR